MVIVTFYQNHSAPNSSVQAENFFFDRSTCWDITPKISDMSLLNLTRYELRKELIFEVRWRFTRF